MSTSREFSVEQVLTDLRVTRGGTEIGPDDIGKMRLEDFAQCQIFDRKTKIHFQYLCEGEFLSLKVRNQVRNGPFTVAAAVVRSTPSDAVEALADVHNLYLLSNYAL